MKQILVLVVIFGSTQLLPFGGIEGGCQNFGINLTGALPNISAGLDVDFPNKGLLIPRVGLTSTTDVVTIPAPATSLLVYNNNAAMTGGGLGYWYWNGTTWISLNGGGGGNAWLLLGNAGTVDAVNFLGTTDNVPLSFRVNNQKAGRIDNTLANTFFGYLAGNANSTAGNNTAIGQQALYSNTVGYENTATGQQALYSNTTGWANTATGKQTLYANTTGEYNTAIGVYALYSNTTGTQNTATGKQALYSNTTGINNTANGLAALYFNVSGSSNTAAGYFALYSNISGGNNTATGVQALYSHTKGTNNTATGVNALYHDSIGQSNTASGFNSLWSNTIGNFNTASGVSALFANTTGTNNTALGYSAFAGGTSYSNSTALGNNAIISASNQVRLGNTSVNDIGGYAAWSNLSDGRFKNNIAENVPGLAFILKLRPVTYHLDMDKLAEFLHTPDSLRFQDAEALKEKMLQTGFIAQEVEKSAEELGYDFSGIVKPKNENDHYGLRYAEFTVPLVKAVQELKAENDSLKLRIEKLQTDYDSRLKKIEELLEKKVEK